MWCCNAHEDKSLELTGEKTEAAPGLEAMQFDANVVDAASATPDVEVSSSIILQGSARA